MTRPLWCPLTVPCLPGDDRVTNSWRKLSHCWRREDRWMSKTLRSGSAASERGLLRVRRNVWSPALSSHPSPAGRVLCHLQSCRRSAVVVGNCDDGGTAGWCWTSRGRRPAGAEGCRPQRHSVDRLAVRRSQSDHARPRTDCRSRRDGLALQSHTTVTLDRFCLT